MKPDENLSGQLKGYSQGSEFGGGKYDAGKYADITWTRTRIAIAALGVALPYIGIIVAVGSAISIGAVMPLIIAPGFALFLMGLSYSIGTLNRTNHRRKRNSRNKRHPNDS